MGIISSASGNSCWSGLEYYKKNKVKNLNKINDCEYLAIVEGTSSYNVYLDIEHPRRSTCNCPFADGRKVICKHIVATYFEAVSGSAEDFEKEQERLEMEYEEARDRQYENAIKYINKMSKKDLCEEFISVLNYAPEWVYEDFLRNHDIR